MLYADEQGRIYEHPYFRMAGFSGRRPAPIAKDDLIPMPEFSKLFYLPGCAPLGLDPETGKYGIVSEIIVGGERVRCSAVAAFPEPGLVRSHLPAADYRQQEATLPLWGYTAVGFKRGRYRIAAFRIESNFRWDPRNFDDRELMPAIRRYQKKQTSGPLLEHLIGCAVQNHCFAAKNLFLGRWEAPLPVSRRCNARCLGCLSLQGKETCAASHQRIAFKPDREEIVALAVRHLRQAPDAVVSFGQGCEGEPLTEYRLIADSIREIRRRTDRGTINLNTNGSLPERVRLLARKRTGQHPDQPEQRPSLFLPGLLPPPGVHLSGGGHFPKNGGGPGPVYHGQLPGFSGHHRPGGGVEGAAEIDPPHGSEFSASQKSEYRPRALSQQYARFQVSGPGA